MFYQFDQNNSGGRFVTDDKLCHRLFIEADTLSEALEKAEELGCYWNGVADGIDCSCCGDRWYEPCSETKVPTSYKVGGYGYESREKWMQKYGKYTVKEYPRSVSGMFGSYYEGKISFNSIEEYAQFLADEYGWTIPDIRFFYKNGDVKEIFSNKKKCLMK